MFDEAFALDDEHAGSLVSFPAGRGIQDASVLKIGVGVGEIQLELPYRGARQHPP